MAGRYRLEHEIGRGGNGVVWRAVDLRLGSPVAIKRLHPQGDTANASRERFLREARLGAAVHHENVVRVLDFGVENGDPFMVMEFVSGVSLYEWMQTNGTLDAARAIDIGAQVLEGLHAIHAQGMVHRDLKPENVMMEITPEGLIPKLLDFGVAAVTDPTTGRRSAMTHRRGYAFGTPHYMAPEQARGSSDLDARCDVYGAGILIYEMLTGRVPFEADHPGDLLMAIIEGDPVPLARRRADLPTGLLRVVEVATSRARRHRYSSARVMARTLRAIDPNDVQPPKRRRPWTLWASAAAAVLGLVAADLASSASESVRADPAIAPAVELEMGAPRLVTRDEAAPPVVDQAEEREEAFLSVSAPSPVVTPRSPRVPQDTAVAPEPPLAFRTLDY